MKLDRNNVPIQKKLLRSVNLGHGHCNRAAVSRNRYGVEKTADTHKILINAIKCCLSSRNMIEYHMPCKVVLLRVDFLKMAAVAMETAKMLTN
jgi:hypothetical protein